MKQEKRIQWNYPLLAFAMPFGGMVLFLLVCKCVPFGKYSMLYSDMYHQYYPFFVAFHDALRSGKGLLYTWSAGMGMDYLGLIAYYLASPLNLLSILLPKSWLLGYFSLLVPIKLGLAALSFSLFLKGCFGKNDLSISVFGAFYGLCAWALGYQWNIMWLDTFALLPMVMLGMLGLLREKKAGLYTITLFLSVFSNYYVGLFTCYFVFLTFFVYEFCRWGGWRKFWGDLLRIALYSVLAIGMTAILTFPALGALGSTQSSVNRFPKEFRLNIAKEHNLRGLFRAMRQVAGNMGGALEPTFKEGLPNVYSGIISVILMFLFLLARDVRKRDKVCALGMLVFLNVSFIIRQLDYIWHGFHFTNMIPYRFSFLYTFVVLYMAYRAWLLRKQFPVWKIAAAAVLAAGVLACSDQLTELQTVEYLSRKIELPVYALYNLVFLVLYFMAMLTGRKKKPLPEEATEAERTQARTEERRQRKLSRALLLTVMCAELIANLVCFGIYFPLTGVSNYPKGTEHTASVIRYMKEREERNPFFRAETTHSQTLNDGALNGYNGISTFTSSANVKTTLFMQSLGFSAKNTYNRYLFEESSPVANLFLGLKYMLERDGKDRSSAFFAEINRFGNTVLLENQAYLPLGFLTEPELAELTFPTVGNAFVFQNELFSAASGLTGKVWNSLDDFYVRADGVKIDEQNFNGYCKYSGAESNSNVTYSYVVDRDGFACIHLNLPKRNNFYVSVNGMELYKEKISLDQMLAVGDVKIGDVIDVRVVCEKGESSNMTVRAAVLDNDLFWQGYDRLNESTWKLTKFRSTKVTGTVDCSRDGLLYTSVPQNGNWKALVDGEPAETVLVGECMTAVPLTAGSHQVTLVYRNAAFALGWKVTALCGAVFVMLQYFEYNHGEKAGKYARKSIKNRTQEN